MKAIITKYLPFTNTKPSRIVAKAEGVPSVTTTCGSLEIIAAERGWTHLTDHQAAARLLAEKQGWSTTLVSGGLPDGTWCHCFVPGERHLVAECPCGHIQSLHKDWEPCLGQTVSFHCDHCGETSHQQLRQAFTLL